LSTSNIQPGQVAKENVQDQSIWNKHNQNRFGLYTLWRRILTITSIGVR
jgi:hypothetical protein